MIDKYYQDSVNTGHSHTGAFTYDAVNRLATAVATGNSTYNLTFNYDQYGNMSCTQNGGSGLCPQRVARIFRSAGFKPCVGL